MVKEVGLDEVEPSDLPFWDVLISYYTCIDPRTLSDWQWVWTIKYLKDIRKAENSQNGQHS